ncbi:hypothetical protein U1Q18_051388, partial [Sarracenia purpurea var. burkii]
LENDMENFMQYKLNKENMVKKVLKSNVVPHRFPSRPGKDDIILKPRKCAEKRAHLAILETAMETELVVNVESPADEPMVSSRLIEVNEIPPHISNDEPVRYQKMFSNKSTQTNFKVTQRSKKIQCAMYEDKGTSPLRNEPPNFSQNETTRISEVHSEESRDEFSTGEDSDSDYVISSDDDELSENESYSFREMNIIQCE